MCKMANTNKVETLDNNIKDNSISNDFLTVFINTPCVFIVFRLL